jgi:hypothetical protein
VQSEVHATPQREEEDEERWLPEVQTLKHQQNPSG